MTAPACAKPEAAPSDKTNGSGLRSGVGRPGRALKRLTTIQHQKKLLKKYRKKIQQLEHKYRRQRYLVLLARMERLEIAYRHCPAKPVGEALRRLHTRMLALQHYASAKRKPKQDGMTN